MGPARSNGGWGLAVKVIAAFIAAIGLIMGGVYFVNSKVDKTEFRSHEVHIESDVQSLEERKLDKEAWKTWREQDQQIQQMQIERLKELADQHEEFERKSD